MKYILVLLTGLMLLGCSAPSESQHSVNEDNDNLEEEEESEETDGTEEQEATEENAADELINEIKQETKSVEIERLLLRYDQDNEDFYREVANHLVDAFSGVTKEEEEEARGVKENVLAEFEPEEREIYDNFVDELIDVEIEYNENE